jgi:hypothetical protein
MDIVYVNEIKCFTSFKKFLKLIFFVYFSSEGNVPVGFERIEKSCTLFVISFVWMFGCLSKILI